MEIKVTGITEPVTVAKGKNNWQELEVSYTNNKGNGKKKLRDFADVDCFKFFSSGLVQVNDKVNVDIKKEGDFWNWKGASVMETGTASPSAVKGTPTAAKKGDWETSEERAARQRHIVRQSTIDYSLKYWGLVGSKPTIEQVLEVAATFERHVFDKNVASEQPIKPKGRPKATSKPIVEEGEDDIEEIS